MKHAAWPIANRGHFGASAIPSSFLERRWRSAARPGDGPALDERTPREFPAIQDPCPNPLPKREERARRERFTTSRAIGGARYRGFTLIEVLVSMILVAVVLTVSMEGISIATRVTADARRRDTAVTLAAGKLDEIVATTAWQTGQMAGDFGPELKEYRWAAQVLPWGNGTMNELAVLVYWSSRRGEESAAVTTLIVSDASTTTDTTATP